MNKIKIIHVIGKLDIGGAERLLLDLGRKIDKTRFEIQVVTLGGEGALMKEFEAADVPVIVIEKKFKGDFRVIGALADWFKKEKPDIVHTHLFIGDFWGGMAARKAGVRKIISTKHDVLNEGFLRNKIGQYMRRKFDLIVAISQATKNKLVVKEKISKQKIQVIYNGIDMAKYYVPESDILNEEEVVFGSVGRLSKEKGHVYLIKALRHLKQRGWKAVLVGDGKQKKKLQQMVRRFNLQDKVHFAGAVSDVRSNMAEFDVFVLPSLSEGLSLALIEAAAAGKFIVAANVGGVSEVVRGDDCGFLYHSKSIPELVRILNWVFDHRDEARKSAKRLQNFVIETFDINKIIEQYESLYEDFAHQ